MPRKIKVVDVLPETDIDDTVQQLDMDNDKPVEPIEEDIEPIEDKDYMLRNVPQQIAIIPETKVRTNELHACSKCGKFMTLQTLKYTYENTCTVKEPPPKPEKPTPKTKGRPKKEIVLNNQPKIQEEKEVEEKQEVQVFEPEPRKSFENN